MKVPAQTRRAVIRSLLAAAVMSRPVSAQALQNSVERTGVETMRIKCAFDRHSFTATLFESPSARDLASMLPLDLIIEDYSTNEKIAYIPRKLTEDGSGPFSGEGARRPLLLRALGQPCALPRRLPLFAWAHPARSP